MPSKQGRENACFPLPIGKGSENVVTINTRTPSLGGFTFKADAKSPCLLGLSQSPNVPAGNPNPHSFHKTYDLHSLLQLTDVTSSLTPSPPRRDSESYHSDSSIRLHRELFDRRSSSPEGLANDRKWLISESESDFDSGSEINIVSVDATGRVSRISRFPLCTSHPALTQVEFDIVPLPSDLKGRLQSLERRARVEVLHDVRPKRELTEQEEFIAWMNQDGVRMLLTPASHAALKAWLDAGDEPNPFQAGSNITATSPGVGFRVCVEEDSDVEGQERQPALNTDRYTPLLIYSALRSAAEDHSDDDDEGFDADVED